MDVKKVIKKKVGTKNTFIQTVSDYPTVLDSINHNFIPSFEIETSPSAWVLPNRVKFNQWLDSTFKYAPKKEPKQNCNECNDGSCPMVKVESINLFPHQKFIKDYIQFASPYRGMLLYHGLGVGKSCTSIAAAELLMNHMEVVIMLPAALRGNYKNEIKKCGRRFYGLKQNWKFIPLDSIKETSFYSKLHVSPELLAKHGGLWVPYNKAGVVPNYMSLPSESQKQIFEQIDNIIESNYNFINYNGLSKAKLLELSKSGNPFDNKCIIIDEVHNMVSGIVNGGIIGTALYKLLWSAKNCKLIMLSGTPIINYPYEIAYLINLITGPKIRYTLQVTKKSDFDIKDIESVMKSNTQVDYIKIDPNNKTINFTLLPEGFEFSNINKLEVTRSLTPKRDDTVIDDVIKRLKKKGISLLKKRLIKEYKTLPEDENEFNKHFVDMENSTIINKRLFSRRILGSVSYYSTYSPELYPEWEIVESLEDMSDVQFPVYEKSRHEERKKEGKKSKKNDGNVFKDTGQVYRFYSRANCNFVFPSEIKRPFPSLTLMKNDIDDEKGIIDMMQKEGKVFGEKDTAKDVKEYDKAISNALDKLSNDQANYLHLSNIGKYSPKFKKIIERVDELHGNCLIYSQFRRVEGLGILSLALNANGYAQFKIKKSGGEWDIDMNDEDFKKPKYIAFTGNNEETQVLLKIFNSDIDNIPPRIRERLSELSFDSEPNNIRGSIIKVLMITQSGAEGISLKNVRQVHIVEPYWNYIRIDQVVGRAVRTCSHVDLPSADRKVSVFIYNLVFTKEQLAKSFTLRTVDDSKTTDEYIFGVAKKKASMINALLDTIKQSSVDCALNTKQHSNMKCFSFPVNIDQSDFSYALDMNDETFDEQYQKDVFNNEWKGQVLITKKGNFLLRTETNEVYDYDIYLNSGKLVKIGELKVVDNKKHIVKS